MSSSLFPAGQANLGLDGDDFDALYNYFVDDSAGQSIAADDGCDTSDSPGDVENHGAHHNEPSNNHSPIADEFLDTPTENNEGSGARNGSVNDDLPQNTPHQSFSELGNNDKQGFLIKYLYEHQNDGIFIDIFGEHPNLLAHALRTLDDDENVLYKFLSKHRDIVGKFLERHNNISVLAEFLEKYPAAMHHILQEEPAFVENFLRDNPEALRRYLDSNTNARHSYLTSNPEKLQNFLHANPEIVNTFLDKNPELVGTWLRNRQGPTENNATINPQLLIAGTSTFNHEHFAAVQGSAEHPVDLVSPNSPFLSIEIDTQPHSSSQIPTPSSQTTFFEQRDPANGPLYISDTDDDNCPFVPSTIDKGKNKADAGSVNNDIHDDNTANQLPEAHASCPDNVLSHHLNTQSSCSDRKKDTNPNTATFSDDNDDWDSYKPRKVRPRLPLKHTRAGFTQPRNFGVPATRPRGIVKHQPRTSRNTLNPRRAKIIIDSDDDYEGNNDYNTGDDDNDNDNDFKPAPQRASSALIAAAMIPIQHQPSLVPQTSTTTSVAAGTIIAPTTSVIALEPGTTVIDPDYRMMNAGDVTIAYIPYPAPATALAADVARQRGTKREWGLAEEDRAIQHMLDVRDEAEITGEGRFREVARRLNAESGNIRSWASVKNFWNRAGRVRSGFDERRRRKAPLATSLQGKQKKSSGASGAGAAARGVGGGLAASPAPARQGRKCKVKEEEEDDDDEDDEEEEEEHSPERDEASARALSFGTRQKKKVKYSE